jgi:signal peptidase II
MLPSWPVFNVADMCINVAAVLILLQAFRGIRVNGRLTSDQVHGDPAGEDTGGGPAGTRHE